MVLRSIHTVIITPDWCAEVGRKFDPKAFIDGCKRAGIGDIEFYTKSALGDALFPYKQRKNAQDWTTQTRELARAAQIRFRVYYNVGLDGRVAKVHPEWTCKDAAGAPMGYGGEPMWMWMCIRSGWRQRVMDELKEVAEAVKPDGFWLDLLGGPGSYSDGELDVTKVCHCEHCRSAYQHKTGQPMPVESNDINVRRTVYELAQESRTSFIRDMVNMLRKIDPKISIGYNHAGDFWDRMGVPEKDQNFQEGIDLYSLEAKPHSQQSFRSKALWSQGHEFEIMTFGNFQRLYAGAAAGSWIDWNLIPPGYQEVSGAIVSAHGGRYIIGLDPLPDGTVHPGEFDNISSNLHEIEKREKWLSDITSVPNIAIVYDVHAEYARRLVLGRGVREDAEGLHEALQDMNAHFDVVHAEFLDTHDYRVLLCGDIVCPGEELSEKVRSFVRGGGLLIATNETSLWKRDGERLPDFAWGDMLGVKFEGFSPYKTANYALLGDEIRGSAPKYPILVTDRVTHVASTTARQLAEIVYPEAERTKDTYLWPGSPHNHPKQSSGKPFMTVNKFGDGHVVYIAAPIGHQINIRNDVWLKYVVAQAIREYSAPLAIEVQAPPGIGVVLGRSKHLEKGRPVHVLSLINRYGGMIVRPGADRHPQAGPISVRIPISVLGKAPTWLESIGADGMRWNVDGEALNVQAAKMGHHGVLRIS